MKRYLIKLIILIFFGVSNSLGQTPIFHLPMNGNANDISGNGLHGVVNAATLTTDRMGNANSAYEFNGTSSNIMLPFSSLYNIPSNGQFTLSAWILPFSSNSTKALVVRSDFNTDFYLSMWNYGLYILSNKAMSGYANNNFLVGSSTFAEFGCWHHLAVTYNNGIWVLYVDGKMEAQDNSQTKFITQSATAPIGIGRKGAASGDYFNGKIDDVRMYNSALTLAQVKQQVAYAGEDVSICLGSSYQLNGVGAGTAHWMPNFGLNNQNVINPIATPSQSTQYILTLTQGVCTTKDTVNVTVENCCNSCNSVSSNLNVGLVACYPFTGNANDSSGNNNHGSTVIASLTTDRFGKPNRAYNFNGSSYIEVPNSLTLSSTTNALTISFWVKISSWVYQNGVNYASVISKSNSTTDCSFRYSITPYGASIINNGKLWNYTPGPMINPLNTWIHFVVTVNGNTLNLYKNGAHFGSTTSFSSFVFSNNNYLQIGRDYPGILDYFYGVLDDVRIYNRDLSSSEVNQLYLISSTEALPFANAGTDIQTCAADSFQLSGIGNGAMSWRPTSPLNNSAILTPKGKVGLGTTNFILTNNFGGCVVVDTVKVIARNTTAAIGSDQNACIGDSISISANADSGTFVWSPIVGMSNSNTLTPKIKVTGPMQIIFTRTLGACVARDTMNIIINSPTVDAGLPKSICPGDSVTLNGSTNGLHNWWPGSSLNDSTLLAPKARPDTTTMYYLNSNIGGCFAKDSVLVTVENITANAGPDRFSCKSEQLLINGSGNGTNFSWSPIKYILNNLTATPTVNPDTTTTYILSTWNNTCIRRDTMTVFVNTLDAKILNKNVEYCIGDTIQISGWVNGPNYTWLPAGQLINDNTLTPLAKTISGNKFYLKVSDANCTRMDSVELKEKIIQVSAGLDTVLCMGDSVQLNALSVPGASYRWNPSGGLSSPTIQNPLAFPSLSTQYLVEAKLGNCFATDTVEVLVDTKPIVSAGLDKRYCFGESVLLDGDVSNASSFEWSPAVDLSDIKQLKPSAFGAVERQYILLAKNGVCMASDTVIAKPNPKVVAKFTPSVRIANFPALIKFSNESENAYFFKWTFDSLGNISNLRDPEFTYTTEGKYYVWLLASDSLGCKDSTNALITIIDNPFLFVPNGFTPNGDLLNDVFQVKYNESAFEVLKYSIYNRWGDRLIESEFPNGTWWNGTFKNEPCPDGVYFFIVYAKSLNGKVFDLHGTLTLLR